MFLPSPDLDQRTNAGEDAEDVGARSASSRDKAPAVSSMNSISWSSATGSSGASSIGVSVVPTSVWPCHGMREHHAAVPGVRHHDGVVSPGRNERSSTMCAPWLGAIIFFASGSASWRTESVNGAGGVDDDLGLRARSVSPGLDVLPGHAVDDAVGALVQAR